MSEPIRYDNRQYMKLENLKVYLPLYPEFTYGQKVVVEGIVNGDHLDDPKLIEVKESNNLIYKLREKIFHFYETVLPSPHAGLVAGMVIGAKSGLTSDFWEKLKNSGTAHVVVASGMNVSLVSGFLLTFFTIFFRRKFALLFTVIGIFTYTAFSGFDAPIIRAAIMGTVAFTAEEFGRPNVSIRALILSGLIMMFINPSFAIDAGFLLSFFATLGIILFEKRISRKLLVVPEIIRADLTTTLSAQIFVFPLLYYFFGRVNIYSPIINVLVLWTVVPITIIGMVAGIVGIGVPIIGQGLLYLAYPLTSWFVWIVNITG